MAKVGEVYSGNWLKAEDLKGREVSVTIEEVEYTKLEDKRRAVLHFVGKEKQLLLNVTNANMIAELLDTDEMDDWVGRRIMLYSTRVDFQGKRVDAIRVKEATQVKAAAKAKRQPEPEPDVEDNTPDYEREESPF